jgi:hypothetical protein
MFLYASRCIVRVRPENSCRISGSISSLCRMVERTLEMMLGKYMGLNDISLRQGTSEDEPFLLALRRLTMDEHLMRVGEPTDDAAHLTRIRYRACDAHIVCRSPARPG